MKYYDITPKISEKLSVFPGDVSFARSESLSFEKQDHLRLSSVTMSLHIGAHADSSSHYHEKGEGIESRPLSAYFGDCQVIDVSSAMTNMTKSKKDRILSTDLKTSIQAPRVLFKTNSFPNPNLWNSDFLSLSPELIYFLHEQGVKLVGIDTPSVDPENSKALESHQALYKTGMAVIEGIKLQKVPEGVYKLVAFPLPILGGDASPVRAILIADSYLWKDSDLQEVK